MHLTCLACDSYSPASHHKVFYDLDINQGLAANKLSTTSSQHDYQTPGPSTQETARCQPQKQS